MGNLAPMSLRCSPGPSGEICLNQASQELTRSMRLMAQGTGSLAHPGISQRRARNCFFQTMSCSTHSVSWGTECRAQQGVHSTPKAHRLPLLGAICGMFWFGRRSLLADQHFQNLLSSVGFINFCLDHFSLKEKEKKPPKKKKKPQRHCVLVFQKSLMLKLHSAPGQVLRTVLHSAAGSAGEALGHQHGS